MHDATQSEPRRPKLNVEIRRMDGPDVPTVMAIDHLCDPAPWQQSEVVAAMNEVWCVGLVALVTNHVVGFACFEIEKTFLAVRRLHVSPQYRRRGVGSRLIDTIKDRAAHQKRYVEFELWEHFVEGQCLLRSADFRAESILRDYFCEDSSRDGDDAYRFVWRPQR